MFEKPINSNEYQNKLQKIKEDFERWVVTELKLSIERYNIYPYSYKVTDINAYWQVWKASYNYYKGDYFNETD